MRTPLKSKAVGTILDKLLKRVAPLIMHWALGLTILSAVTEFWTLGHREWATLVGATGPTSWPIPPWSTAFYPLIGLTHWPFGYGRRDFAGHRSDSWNLPAF